MKKVLLATSALVAFAGAASAEVTVSGYARVGVVSTTTNAVAAKDAVVGAYTAAQITALDAATGGTTTAVAATSAATADTLLLELRADRAAAVTAYAGLGARTTDEQTTHADALAAWDAAIAAVAGTDATAATAKKTNTDISNRMELNFGASFESTDGIMYGGKMRVRSDGDNAHFNAPQMSIKYQNLSIVAGNNNGQMYSANAGGTSVGFTGLGFRGYVVGGFDEYSSYGKGSQGVDVNFSMDGISVGVSRSKTTNRTQAGISYTNGALTLGASMQDGKTAAEDMRVFSAGYKLDGMSFDLAYGETDGTTKTKKTRVGGTFEVGAATKVTAFALDSSVAGTKTVYGVGLSHNLGGASLAAGYVKHDTGSAADLGITFNF